MLITPSDTTAGVYPVLAPPAPDIVPVFRSKVMVALPWHKYACPLTSFCVAQIIDRRRTASVLNYGDAFVTHSRNTAVEAFLSSPCEWMLTIDDDMVVPFGNKHWFQSYTGFSFPEKFLSWNALDRLMSHGKTLVGALYFAKHPKGNAVYGEAAGNQQETDYARSGPYDLIKPTRWVGTGCLLAHRSVFLDIEKRFPELARSAGGKSGHWFSSTEANLKQRLVALRDYLGNGAMTGEKSLKALELVEALLLEARNDNSLGVGEDVSLCLRAAAAGHQPYVDMGLRCGHVGQWVF